MFESLRAAFQRTFMRESYINTASRSVVHDCSSDHVWQRVRPLIVYNAKNPTDATVALANCLRMLDYERNIVDLFYLASKVLHDPIARESFVARQQAMWWVADGFADACNEAESFKERADVISLAADVHRMAVEAGAGGAMHEIKGRIENEFAVIMPLIEEKYAQRITKSEQYMGIIRECANMVGYRSSSAAATPQVAPL